MDWVSENHYAMIVYQERLERASRPGPRLDLRRWGEALAAWWVKATAGTRAHRWSRWYIPTARPAAGSAD